VTTYIALLRAINLAGHKSVAMSDLRDLLTQLQFQNPRTLLQSGNLVFQSDGRSAATLERRLETEAAKRLRLETEFFVRSALEWRSMVDGNPFPREAKNDPAHLLLLALKDAPGGDAVKALQDAIRDREVVRADGRAAYVVYPDGIGRSRLTMALIEKKLGTRATGRNWNTVLKLAALISPDS